MHLFDAKAKGLEGCTVIAPDADGLAVMQLTTGAKRCFGLRRQDDFVLVHGNLV
jgi:hypothetical protein